MNACTTKSLLFETLVTDQSEMTRNYMELHVVHQSVIHPEWRWDNSSELFTPGSFTAFHDSNEVHFSEPGEMDYHPICRVSPRCGRLAFTVNLYIRTDATLLYIFYISLCSSSLAVPCLSFALYYLSFVLPSSTLCFHRTTCHLSFLLRFSHQTHVNFLLSLFLLFSSLILLSTVSFQRIYFRRYSSQFVLA